MEASELYEITDVPNEYKGVYIHVKLINRVAMWTDLEYSFKVDKIMDAINNSDLEMLKSEIESLNTRLFLESTRCADRRYLFIKTKDSGYCLGFNRYTKLDSKDIFKTYEFPDANDIRSELRLYIKSIKDKSHPLYKQYVCKGFTEEVLPLIEEWLMNKNPISVK